MINNLNENPSGIVLAILEGFFLMKKNFFQNFEQNIYFKRYRI